MLKWFQGHLSQTYFKFSRHVEAHSSICFSFDLYSLEHIRFSIFCQMESEHWVLDRTYKTRLQVKTEILLDQLQLAAGMGQSI